MKRIISITILIMIIFTIKVNAATSKISALGDTEVLVEKAGTVAIKVESDTLIGVVSGTIKAEGNISIENVTGQNGWSLTYNKSNGMFNVLKADGAKSESILTIEYKAGTTAGTGKIILSDIKLTTTDYASIDQATLTKEITVKSNSPVEPVDNENGKISFVCADKINTGKNGTATIKVESDTLIGVVSGTIKAEGNISIENVTGQNGWSLTYNKSNGMFNVLKADGAKSESILTIEYKAGTTAGTGKIILSDIKLTTTDYASIDQAILTKEIAVNVLDVDPSQDPDKDPSQDPDKDPTQDPDKDPTQDPDKDPTQDPDKDPTQDPDKDPTYEPDKTLPQTGSKEVIVPSLILIVISAISFILFKRVGF